MGARTGWALALAGNLGSERMTDTPSLAVSRRSAGLAAALATLFAGVLILGTIAISIVRFHGQNYYADEVNTVHAGVILNAADTVQWLSLIHI